MTMHFSSLAGRRLALACLLAFWAPAAAAAGRPADPIVVAAGPHLFIDDHLIAGQSFLSRTVQNPAKRPEPVVLGGRDKDECFQPYLTVLRDPDSGRFRLWYGTPETFSQSHIGYMESENGIDFIRPHRILQDPHVIKFGVCVLDRREYYPDPLQRYVFAAYMKDGLMISTSADGLTWKALRDTSVLKHNHDISFVYWDPLRKWYSAIVSIWQRREDWKDNERMPFQSVSRDLIHWEKPWQIIGPKAGAPLEQGEMQFYAMAGVLCRGDLLIGLCKVLRDDLNATPGKSGVEMGDPDRKAAGLGYTVLAWSRDGRTWQRDHEPFLDRDPLPGRWDHAFAWGDHQLLVGDETYIYYGGYARGHKIARYEERQIGLARMPRDRYVAREADITPGRLLTPPLRFRADRMRLNARISGFLRLRLTDERGRSIPGFDWIEIKGDGIALPVDWKGALTRLREPARIEFEMKYAQLFGFTLE